MTLTPLYIPDTSPFISYGPCTGCSPSSGWESAYAPKSDGYDQTFHQTLSFDATISFDITASSLSFSSALPGGVACNAVYSINGSSPKSACATSSSEYTITSLPLGIHQVVLRPQYVSSSNTSLYEFFGISGQISHNTTGGSPVNSTFDTTTSKSFVFSPESAWTQFDGSGINTGGNTSLISSLGDSKHFFGGSVSATTESLASASLDFAASAVYLYGLSGPNGGNAQVSLNGVVTATLNLTNPWRAYSSLLYMNTGLDPSSDHQLTITNLSPGKQLVLDYVVLTNTPKSSNTNLPLILGAAGGGTIGLLIVGIILFFLVSRHRNRIQSKNMNGGSINNNNRSAPATPQPYEFAKGISSEETTSPKKLGFIDRWRQQASRKHLSLSSQSTAPIVPPRVEYPYPDPPDYIPYNGPISSPPPFTSNASSSSGSSNQSHRIAVPSPTHSKSSNRSRRPSPLPLKGYEDIALSEYSSRRQSNFSILSPSISTPSTIGMVATTTARAVNARRSVATLWPTSKVIPSYYRADDSNSHLPTTSVADDSNNPSQLTLGRSLPDSRVHLTPTPIPETPSTGYSVLRRGVSIKSVKTMRSFFSSLLSTSSPTQQTPAMPVQAARPDSDIFPSALSRQPSSKQVTALYTFKRDPEYDIKITPTKRGGSAADHAGGGMIGAGRRGQEGRSSDSSPDFFFELNPYSPITASRPGSYMTNANHMSFSYRSGGGRI